MSQRAADVDLRGVPCPINWARAKVRLEAITRGERLTFWIDDPRSVRDMPRAAEAEGHVVHELTDAGSYWLLVIEK